MLYIVIHSRTKKRKASFLTMETANIYISKLANPSDYTIYTKG